MEEPQCQQEPPPPPPSPSPSSPAQQQQQRQRQRQPVRNPTEGRRLFVRNIGYRRQRESLIKYYTKFFGKFGPVEYFDAIWDHIRKTPKGYGFVTFRNQEGAQRALSASPEELAIPGSDRVLIVYPATKKTMEMIKIELKELRKERESIRQHKLELLSSPVKDSEKGTKGTETNESEDDGQEEDDDDNEKEKAKDDNPKSEQEKESDENVVLPVDGNKSPANESSKDKVNPMTLSKLNNETLQMIFDYLPIRERFRCSMVNSRFNLLMETTWAGTSHLSFKESFCLWGGQTLDSNILFKILRKCPALKVIDLYQTATTLDDKTCDIIGRCCPLLEKLVIRDTALNKYSVTTIGKFCPNLKSIDFAKCINITEKGLWGLFSFRPNLEQLILSHCEQFTGRCFYLLNNLDYLDVSNCSPVLNTSYSRLAQNCDKKLRTLITAPMTNDGLAYICRTFLNLERLEVDQTADQPVLNGAIYLGQLARLEKLIFRPELSDLNDETFHYIFSCLPYLQELTMFGTDKITDLSVIALPDQCPNLRLINLEGFKFGDPTIKSFARFKHLESLTVSGSLITDEGVYFLLTQSPQLELLGVNSCLGISLQTLYNAYDLVNQGLANKSLIICYNNCRIRITEFADKDDIRRYESKDIWGSDEEYLDYPDFPDYLPPEEDDYDDHHDYYFHEVEDDYDDYIADGDLDYEEEELT